MHSNSKKTKELRIITDINSRYSNLNNQILEIRNIRQIISIENYMNQNNNIIKNSGYLDIIKATFNTRILSLNPREYRSNNQLKVQILINRCEKYNIDIILLNETNTKWIVLNRDTMKRKLKSLGREIQIETADSKS